jgi:hypothetical protein
MKGGYRVYLLNPSDQSIRAVFEIGRSSDDEDALMKAQSFFGTSPAELWDCARRVYRYEPRHHSRN